MDIPCRACPCPGMKKIITTFFLIIHYLYRIITLFVYEFDFIIFNGISYRFYSLNMNKLFYYYNYLEKRFRFICCINQYFEKLFYTYNLNYNQNIFKKSFRL